MNQGCLRSPYSIEHVAHPLRVLHCCKLCSMLGRCFANSLMRDIMSELSSVYLRTDNCLSLAVGSENVQISTAFLVSMSPKVHQIRGISFCGVEPELCDARSPCADRAASLADRLSWNWLSWNCSPTLVRLSIVFRALLARRLVGQRDVGKARAPDGMLERPSWSAENTPA